MVNNTINVMHMAQGNADEVKVEVGLYTVTYRPVGEVNHRSTHSAIAELVPPKSDKLCNFAEGGHTFQYARASAAHADAMAKTAWLVEADSDHVSQLRFSFPPAFCTPRYVCLTGAVQCSLCQQSFIGAVQ